VSRAATIAAAVLAALTLAAPAFARPDFPRPLTFSLPADGVVTGPFGEWRGGHSHAGIDFGLLRSLTVRAAASGVVRSAGYLAGYEGYGLTVIVQLDNAPYQTLYAHLSSTRVEPGDYVDAGDVIGRAGCSGSCSGTHLHFELRRAGVAIDPTPFLRDALRSSA
jgi:murein DD-endopeptidase MepM/ murein hydrolase activator NlpD